MTMGIYHWQAQQTTTRKQQGDQDLVKTMVECFAVVVVEEIYIIVIDRY